MDKWLRMVSVRPLLTPQGHMFWNSVFKFEKYTVHMVYLVTLPAESGPILNNQMC